MALDLSGVFVPVVTPFDPQTELVDIQMLHHNIEKLNETNVRGYMPLGSNGEFFMLTDEEALTVMKVVKEVSIPSKLVFAGVGRESTRETISFINKVAVISIDAVFVLTPHYFPKQITQESLINYYTEVADESPIPVVLYSAPGYAAGINIEPETVKILSSHKNIIGIKDTGSQPIDHYLDSIKDGNEFAVLAGTFGKFFDGIRKGALGGVLSSANYIPELCCQLYELVKAGEYEKAKTLHLMMGELAASTTATYGVSGVKAAMNILGYSCGIPRKPLKAVLGENLSIIEKNLKEGLNNISDFIHES
ncbi:MAG: dihydrodipicolinate synthase family protein [Mobilitalea sp.]